MDNNSRFFEEAAEYLKALAHPTRLRILEFLLREKETCVKSLWEELGLQQSNVSQHLAMMKQRGIIDSRKDGVKTCYWIADSLAPKIYQMLKETFSE
ncbi:ArsR family transcriptional regulator [Thermosulfidibacter takaii ABI70S6]|uniref:ArsR family transcriptional regulator n=1 Tax=Thermosulfidibacter takaii (strain DSM 17441 / JCM 13301 / NBRC 103674 / ABI70S6) TaxID=1298851 RepID=A0A0S3QW25_THET7|nr:metalloregulator ArsR/SmtB family transcription factor [Thermosulfidibacter takaii]BAT72520.1 ArsR family transcriptional regulator [Thermosulfidibacter takaii ABI70S6]